MYLISEDYLAHHGIKGQKWGVRRYRNTDGTLTEEGKKRYNVGPHDSRTYNEIRRDRRNAMFTQDIKVGKDKPNKSPAEGIASEAQKTVGNVRKGIRAAKNLKSSKKSYSNGVGSMSDEELKQRVSRLQLERQYKDLSAGDISRGEYTVSNVLDLTESIASVAVSAATVYALVSKINKA